MVIHSQAASQLLVRVGEYHLNEDDPDQQDIPVKTILLHEDYDSYSLHNDICILELDGIADFSSPYIGYIDLPLAGEEYPVGEECVVCGWGTTSEDGSHPTVLMKVTIPLVSDDTCRAAYGEDEIVSSQVCAGPVAGGKDSCTGDDGGPLMCGSQLSGVVSWGYGCARPALPGIYTQTSYYVPWINRHIK